MAKTTPPGDQGDHGALPPCLDPLCWICTTGQRTGESREVWIARLHARFRADPMLEWGIRYPRRMQERSAS